MSTKIEENAQRAYEDATQVRAGHESFGELVSKVTADISEILRKEVQLAKVELKAEGAKAAKSGVMFASGAYAGMSAILFLSLALMFLLGALMPLGWAALIVGVIWALAALALTTKGKEEIKHVNGPEQTIESIKEMI